MAPQPRSGVGAKAYHVMHIIITIPGIPMLIIPFFTMMLMNPQPSHMSVLVAPGIVAIIFIMRLLLGRGCTILSFLRVGSAVQLCPRRNHAQTPNMVFKTQWISSLVNLGHGKLVCGYAQRVLTFYLVPCLTTCLLASLLVRRGLWFQNVCLQMYPSG